LRHSIKDVALSQIEEEEVQIPIVKNLSPLATLVVEEHIGRKIEVVDQLKLSTKDQSEKDFKTSSLRQQSSQHILTVKDFKTAFSDHASYPRKLFQR
jgi:hypothetical protein